MKEKSTMETSELKSVQIVVFKLGQEEYGLPIEQIKEVVITPTITKIPQSPSYMKGVANIRGNVIAILDLEEKFGLTADVQTTRNAYTLVIESEEYKMGIIVREVPNTLSISASAVDDSLFTGDQQDQAYISGIIRLEKRLIIMIDIFKVINDRDSAAIKKAS